jgi:hypothetical protein
MSGLLALCGLALLVQHVAELGSNFTGDHLVAGALMLGLAVIVWFLPSKPKGIWLNPHRRGAAHRGQRGEAAGAIEPLPDVGSALRWMIGNQ